MYYINGMISIFEVTSSLRPEGVFGNGKAWISCLRSTNLFLEAAVSCFSSRSMPWKTCFEGTENMKNIRHIRLAFFIDVYYMLLKES